MCSQLVQGSRVSALLMSSLVAIGNRTNVGPQVKGSCRSSLAPRSKEGGGAAVANDSSLELNRLV